MKLDTVLSRSVANTMANAFFQDGAGRVDVALADLRLARDLLDSLIRETESRIGVKRDSIMERIMADSDEGHS
jgi:hypothetical protein